MRTHRVKKGERLVNLSTRYYGTYSKWRKIVDANPQLSGRKKATDGSPLIYPSDVLIIPEETKNATKPIKLAPEKIQATSDDEVSIKIDGNKFIFFDNYELIQEIDTFDSFSLAAPFDPTKQIYRDSFRPFTYKEVQIYYGEDLFFNGVLLSPQSNSTKESKTMQVKGYPRCGFLECPLPITKFPAEFNNQDLQKIAESLAEPFGVPVEFKDAAGNKFKKTAIKPEEKVIDFIIKLAGERGLLVSNNAQGGLLFWKASSGKATASIKEGEFPYLSCQPTFNPQEYYSHITGLSKTTNTKKAAKYTVENSFLIKHGVTRPFNYLVEDDEEGDLKDSVKSKAARMFANACSYELVVQGHKSKDNKRWAKNTLISVMAPGAMIYKDTTFLIKKCRTLKNSNSGSTTELSLVLPSSYSGEMPEVIPWED